MMLHSCYDVNEKGHLTLGGCDTVALAEKYGTPLYLIDEPTVRENCRLYMRAMKKYFGGESRAHYASKALSFKGIYRIMAEEGMHVDVVSIGEMYTAEKAGFPLANACFHGNNKTDEDIEAALEAGIGQFVVDSFEELEALDRLAGEKGIRQRVLLRITPNIDCHTLKAINTGELDSKFGTPIETGQAMKFVKTALTKKNIELLGFHSHCGSQVFEVQPFVDQAEVMLRFMADVKKETGYEADVINLGGGFGVRYHASDPVIDVEDSIRIIADEVSLLCAQKGLKKPAICMEPGRSIVAAAGITLYTVGSVKDIEGYRTYVSVNGGMTDNPRYALYKSVYEVTLANKAALPKDLCCTVAGCCCESGDLIGENMQLQTPVRGDILAVLVTGAYNYSMASNYNRVPRPALVFTNNGKDRLGIRRESLDDLLLNDL